MRTRSFETRADYEAFVDTVVQRMNARVAKLLAAERAVLKSLPVRRTAEFEEWYSPKSLDSFRLGKKSRPANWAASTLRNFLGLA